MQSHQDIDDTPRDLTKTSILFIDAIKRMGELEFGADWLDPMSARLPRLGLPDQCSASVDDLFYAADILRNRDPLIDIWQKEFELDENFPNFIHNSLPLISDTQWNEADAIALIEYFDETRKSEELYKLLDSFALAALHSEFQCYARTRKSLSRVDIKKEHWNVGRQVLWMRYAFCRIDPSSPNSADDRGDHDIFVDSQQFDMWLTTSFRKNSDRVARARAWIVEAVRQDARRPPGGGIQQAIAEIVDKFGISPAQIRKILGEIPENQWSKRGPKPKAIERLII